VPLCCNFRGADTAVYYVATYCPCQQTIGPAVQQADTPHPSQPYKAFTL